MWVVIAAAACILAVGLLALVRAGKRDTKMRRARIGRPEYPDGHQSIAAWRLACAQSLQWSQTRRNKEAS